MKHLTSRDNAAVKQLIALAHSSRERKKSGLSVLDGVHLIDAYRQTRGAPQLVAVADSALQRDDVRNCIRGLEDKTLVALPDAFMKDVSSLDTPSVAVALVETPRARPTPCDATVLVLEDVQDPGNVGSLLRSAAAAGIGDVVTSKTTAFCWSPKVLRAGQGAHFSLNIQEGVDLADWLADYAGDSIALVAHGEGVKALHDCHLAQPVALLIGNEGAGLTPAIRKRATLRATIPMPGNMESLNAAAAGAVAMFEMVRQRVEKRER
jgi:TrmH family RNA methyltransferase